MDKGWIKLHRNILDWEWWGDINTSRLFIYCLLMANHSTTRWKGTVIEKGSFVTSTSNLAAESGLTIQQTRTALKRLESTSEITCKSTNKYTMITICNYDSYQDVEDVGQQTNNKQITNKQQTNNKQITNKQQTNNKQITTNKNEKNERNINISPTIARAREDGSDMEGGFSVDAGCEVKDVEELYGEYRAELTGETMASESALRMGKSHGVELTKEELGGYLDRFQDRARLAGTRQKTRGDYRRHFTSWFALMLEAAKRQQETKTNTHNYGTTRTDNQGPAEIADPSQYIERL